MHLEFSPLEALYLISTPPSPALPEGRPDGKSPNDGFAPDAVFVLRLGFEGVLARGQLGEVDAAVLGVGPLFTLCIREGVVDLDRPGVSSNARRQPLLEHPKSTVGSNSFPGSLATLKKNVSLKTQ